MSKVKMYMKKSMIVLMGMFFMGIGINLIIYANIGADPFTTGVLGVFEFINKYGEYSFGEAQVAMNIVFITIAFFLNKRKIGIGTLISAIVIGLMVDFWKGLMIPVLPANPVFMLSLACLVIGCTIVGIGIAIYISPDFGLGAGEILPMIISEKTGWKFKYLKVAGDLIFFIIGVSLGAVYGTGTIISLGIIGPVAHHSIPYAKKTFKV